MPAIVQVKSLDASLQYSGPSTVPLDYRLYYQHIMGPVFFCCCPSHHTRYKYCRTFSFCFSLPINRDNPNAGARCKQPPPRPFSPRYASSVYREKIIQHFLPSSTRVKLFFSTQYNALGSWCLWKVKSRHRDLTPWLQPYY